MQPELNPTTTRLGVLDVGSNTVHLLVVDARPGGHPDPVRSHKTELHLAELLQTDGTLGLRGRQALVRAVAGAAAAAEEERVEDLVAFATSAVRDAPDGADAIEQVREQTGIELAVMTGPDEAAMTFFAVRRWLGWSAGRLITLDIGGGSLELAVGRDELPELALSVPLGAGRLTRDHLPEDPPRLAAVAALRELVRTTLEPVVPQVREAGWPDRAVVTSKTFRSLARLDGAAPSGAGQRVKRSLTQRGLARILDDLSGLTIAQRAELPGVSLGRAPQLLAGAIVALETLTALGLDRVELCPWALREGVVLRRLDWLTDGR
jgi:exopolyphosphatase/guanosine-5'-triphosphate,3'-diphosphate pyrophosphatase